MRWKKGTPGEGGEKRHEQFRYVKTGPGLKGTWYGWCAAEPYWCRVHQHTEHTRGTKVCCAWFTDGHLTCPRCKPGVVATDVAYVFLWREEDHAPCLVLCHDSAAEYLAPLKFGAYVMVGRADGSSGAYVKLAADQRRWVSSLPYRQGPCDIAVSLLTLWAYPDLTQWVATAARREKAKAEPSEMPARLRLSVPPPTSDVEALAVDAERKAPTTWDDLTRSILSRHSAASRAAERNGKHPPDPSE